ncbi:hypothetical protein GCM10023196_035700 [Actinoallomurus vinaceus]|uniref:HNH endonuclease n=1 Tax=Actinoallomurus vinaceus TaxID=1080074 RepID=A0ABP8UAI9_9ACTN
MSARRISARPWNRLRAQVLDPAHGGSRVCWLCGHDGATDVDHVIPRTVAPELELDITNLRPAHGVKGCDTCGRKCNREKSDQLTWSAPKHSRVW